MPRTYEVASENISRAIEGLMTTYHPALASHGVTLTRIAGARIARREW